MYKKSAVKLVLSCFESMEKNRRLQGDKMKTQKDMGIKIFRKTEEGIISCYDGKSPIEGCFIVVEEETSICCFCAVGGEYSYVVSHSEIFKDFFRNEGKVVAGGFFGIFPEEETIVFFGRSESLKRAFTKEQVWPAVTKLLRDGIVKHALILYQDALEVIIKATGTSSSALAAFLKHYKQQLWEDEALWRHIIHSFLIREQVVFDNISLA